MKRVLATVIVLVLLTSAMAGTLSVKPALADQAENSWAIMASMPTARTGIGIGVVGGRTYAIGGQVMSGATDVNEMYDPITNTWTTKTPIPQPNGATVDGGSGAAVYQNKIYCFGWELNQVYNTATDSWATKTPSPTPRTTATACTVNGKIYLIGGFDTFFLGTPFRSNVNEMYDPVNDSWTTMAPLPTAVAYCISAVVDNKIYVFGNTGSGNNETQIYDPQTDTWRYGPSMSYHVSYEAGVATTGVYAAKKIYLIGGNVYSDEVDPETGLIKRGPLTQVFDTETETWSVGAEMPTPRHFLSVAVVDDLLYAIGGEDKNVLRLSDANERYTPFGYVPVPPAVNVVSPEQNKIYNVSARIPLTFTVDGFDSWIGYSLNGQPNATITGNTTLPDLPDGWHYVVIYANDTLGNIEASHARHFIVDTTPPTGSITVNGGAASTRQRSVVLTLSAEDVSGVAQMHFSNDGINWTGWEDYADTKVWTLTSGDGSKTVYVQFRDNAGVESITYSDAITLSTPPPREETPENIDDEAGEPTEETALRVLILSPESKAYDAPDVSLVFNVNETLSKVAYSLDGQDNVTVAGNTTLIGLTSGEHTLTVYAWDGAGNVEASETITFTVAESEPFPITFIVVAVAVSAVAVTTGILFYFKKRRR